MNVNLAEFKLLGIEVKVHWSFVLVLAFGAFIYGAGPAGWLIGGLYGVLTMLLLFLCVTLHEYGHALTARRFGIKGVPETFFIDPKGAITEIVIGPVAGQAQMDKLLDEIRPVQ